MNIPYLSIYVTARCNIRCEHCNQDSWMCKYPNYNLSCTDITNIISRSIDLEIHYQQIRLTGGEAPLWPYYTWAIEELAKSPICDTVGQFSNGTPHSVKIIRKVIDYLDDVRITVHPGVDYTDAQQFSDDYPRKVRLFDRGNHRPIPLEPVKGVLPARCQCIPYAYWGGRFMQCSLVRALGDDEQWIAHSCPIYDDFAKFYCDTVNTRYNSLFCERCTMNRRIYE